MQIRVADFVDGARDACGIAVVIDVFRAFSLAAHAFALGARKIIPVAALEDAFRLKAQLPGSLLIAERYARPMPGADAGNSPALLERLDIAGRTLIHSTHAGTQGLTAAFQADEVLAGALVNADAIVRYIRSRAPETVTLVRMGQQASERCEEDDACAELIAARLRGQEPDTSRLVERLRAVPSAAKFFDPACDWAPQKDFDICTHVDRYDFVLRLNSDKKPMELQMMNCEKGSGGSGLGTRKS